MAGQIRIPLAGQRFAIASRLFAYRYPGVRCEKSDPAPTMYRGGPRSLVDTGASRDDCRHPVCSLPIKWGKSSQVAVVDIGKRSIASVADLGRRTVRAENESLVTLSPDGTRLIVSEDVQGQPGTDIASTVHIYDTHTWREVRTIQVAQLLHHAPPAFAPDGQSFYLIGYPAHGKPPVYADTLLQFSLASDQPTAPVVRNGEGIMAVFVGP